MDAHVEEALKRLESGPSANLCSREEYERRLSVCARCPEKLGDGTCRMCGCYVVLRARPASGRCPYKKRWMEEKVE